MYYSANNHEKSYTGRVRVSDIITCVLARQIGNGEAVFHGVASHMPMIAIMMAKATHAPDLVYLNIPGGVNPKPARISSCSTAGSELIQGASAVFGLQEVFDLSMRGGLDVAFLSGIQFDIEGNVNASVIGDYNRPKVRMPGGAGSAVLIPTVRKVVLWRTKHDKRTFVEKVDFVTTRGNIHKIITPLCVFAYREGRLMLESVHPTSSIDEVKANTGFELDYDRVNITEMPTKEEMSTLLRIDPMDLRSREFKT
ncbi:MAG: CoA-transferase subunit beta [Bacillota bacterium]